MDCSRFRRWSKAVAISTILAGSLPLPATLAAETPARLSSDALVVEAKFGGPTPTQRAGDFIAYGFDAIWVTTLNGLVRVDPADNSATTIKIEGAVGGFRAPAAGEGGVWIADVGSEFVFKIDPVTYKTALKFKAKMLNPEGSIAVSGGAVWVVTAEAAESTLTRFNAATGAVEAMIQLPSDGCAVLADYGSIWVTGKAAGEVYRIDPATNAIVQTIAAHKLASFIASGEGSLWVINRLDGEVQRIDGATGEALAVIDTGAVAEGGGIDVGGGYVWVSKGATPLVKIDPASNGVAAAYSGTEWGGAVRYAAGSLWVSGRKDLLRIKPPS